MALRKPTKATKKATPAPAKKAKKRASAKPKLIEVEILGDIDVPYQVGHQSGVLSPGKAEVTPEVHAVLLEAGYLAEE